jgi:hypothetical protein
VAYEPPLPLTWLLGFGKCFFFIFIFIFKKKKSFMREGKRGKILKFLDMGGCFNSKLWAPIFLNFETFYCLPVAIHTQKATCE